MKSKLLSVLVASLFAGAAYAADPMTRTPANPSGSNPIVPFESLDKNNDGALSKDEVKSNSVISKSFGQLDADRDGKLTRAEYEAAGTSTSRVN